jgi:hypothetical protein
MSGLHGAIQNGSMPEFTNATGPASVRAASDDWPLEDRCDQWKLSPQAQDPVAFGLSMVKPCFSMVSMKSMVAPIR